MATKENEQPQQRRQPVILMEPAKQPPAGGRCGEIVGAKTAECAAICCCCPLAAIDLLLFAFVKLPAGMWKKAVRKNRKRGEARRLRVMAEVENKKKADGLGGGGEKGCGGDVDVQEGVRMPAAKVMAREEEMWGQFHCDGFWRSAASQREGKNSVD